MDFLTVAVTAAPLANVFRLSGRLRVDAWANRGALGLIASPWSGIRDA